MKKQKEPKDYIEIKRYGNRRLYNTETHTYLNFKELLKIVRDGNSIKVIDSSTKEDVTKPVLIQMILEEEKSNHTILPTAFLLQLLQTREDSTQDFFKNHLAASFEAYLRTKEEFDKHFRKMLEMSMPPLPPNSWEHLNPVSDWMTQFWKSKKNTEDENN